MSILLFWRYKMKENNEVRIHKNTGYTIMSNIHLKDMELSLKSKGLLSFMLSLPPNWDFSVEGLTKVVKEGYDAIDSAIKELIRHNYIFREESRQDKGRFKYIYHIFENPEENYFKMQNPPVGEKQVPDEQVPEKPEQNRYSNINKINTYKEIDNIDKIDKSKKLKTFEKNITHNILTEELIKQNFIDSDDQMSSFNFDNLFNYYLSNGRSYQELFSSIHYIVSRVIERKFKDEEGNDIENKYGYFKNALESNFQKLDNLGKDLYDDDFWKDFDYGERG